MSEAHSILSLRHMRDFIKASVNKRMPKNKDVVEQIDYFNLESTKQDVQDWQEARQIALDVFIPDWEDLIRVYDDVIVDSHLTGIIETIIDKVKCAEFEIVDSSGKKSDEKTDIFKKKWFFKYLRFAVEAYFYPYSLIQLGSMDDDQFKDIELVKREYIVPNKDFVKKSLYITGNYKHGQDGWVYTHPDMAKYFIMIKSDIELGLLDRVAYHALGKKHMLIYWWRYAELLGIPLRVGKTDIEDNARRRNMENMLKNMGSSLYTVVGLDDQVELKEARSQANINMFKDNMQYSNSEMSKALLGSESMNQEKSFVGSAEVGERLFEAKGKGILRDVTFTINDELIPRMIWYGLPLNGYSFRFVNEDRVTYEQKLKAVQILSPNFELDEKEVGEKTGFTLKKKTIEPKVSQEIEAIKSTNSVMAEVNKMYKISAPLPKPKRGETREDYVSKCISNPVMIKEFPDEKQRAAICNQQYKNNG